MTLFIKVLFIFTVLLNAGDIGLISENNMSYSSEDKYGLVVTNDYTSKTFVAVCISMEEVKETLINNLIEDIKCLKSDKIEEMENSLLYGKNKITYNVCDYEEYMWFQPWHLYDIYQECKIKILN